MIELLPVKKEKIRILNSILFRRGDEDGSALVFFVSILLAMSVLAAYMLDITTISTFGELSYNHLNRAYFLAEAGGNYANKLVKLDLEGDGTYDDTYSLHNQTFTMDGAGGDQDGQFKIVIDNSDPDYLFIHSTGVVSAGIVLSTETTITYSIAKTSSSLFDNPIFAGDEITIKKDTSITGDVGTNDSGISKESGVTISGDEHTNAGRTMESINFSCSNCNSDKEISGSETWSTGTYEFLKVKINESSVLIISGDVVLYVKEDFIAEKESTIRVLANSSLTIYVDKKFELKKEFSVEFDPQPDRAENFVVYGTSNADAITIEKETTFIGAIYAPDADIDIKKESTLTGSIIGKKLNIEKECVITFDPDVEDINSPVGGGGVSLGASKQYFSM